MDADVLRVPAGAGALNVERYGHGGESIVLLHGFGTSSFLWRNVAPALAGAGHTAFAIDLMGYGESDRPIDSDYSIAAQAEYLGRAFAALRLVRPTIVGIDHGGGVALRLSGAAGDHIGRLVLINSVAFDECPARDVRTVQRNTARFAFNVARGILGAAPLLRKVLEGSVADPANMPPRLVARYLAPYVGQAGVAHLLELARSLRATDVQTIALGAISVPTLVIWGEEDPWLDSGLAERLQGAIAGSTLVRLPGVGRLVPEESPEALATLLVEFVARSPEPAH